MEGVVTLLHEKRHAFGPLAKHITCRNSRHKGNCDASLFLPDDVKSALTDKRCCTYSMEVKYLLDVYQYAKPNDEIKRQIIKIVEKLLKSVFPFGGVTKNQLNEISSI